MALNTISTEVIELKIEGAASAEAKLDGLLAVLAQLKPEVEQTDKATEKASERFKELKEITTAVGSGLAGLQAAFAMASKAISTLKAPVNMAIDFERQFAQIKTLGNNIGPELKDQLDTLSTQISASIGSITEGAYQAISAGIDPSQTAEFLKTANDVAVAAGTDLVAAVDLLTGGVNAFGKQGETVATISDKLQATVAEGKTTIPELAATFGRLAGSTASAGVPLNDLLASLALLTTNSVPTSEAVTGINALVSELTNTSSVGAKKMRELGIEVGVTALKEKGLVGILKEVQAATNGEAAAIADLVTSQQARATLMTLTGDNMSKLLEKQDAMVKSQGLAAEATDKVSETVGEQIKMFRNLTDQALRKMGEEALPAVVDLLDTLRKSFLNNRETIGKFGGALANVAKLIKVFVDNIGTISTALGAGFVARMVPSFIASLASMKAAFMAFSADTAALGSFAGISYGRAFGLRAMVSIKSFMLGPAGIGLIAGGLFMLFSSFSEAAEKRRREMEEKAEKSLRKRMRKLSKDLDLNFQQLDQKLDNMGTEDAANRVRMLAATALAQGNETLSDSYDRLARKMEESEDGSFTFADAMRVSEEAAIGLANSLNAPITQVQNLIDEFDNMANAATTNIAMVEVTEKAGRVLMDRQAVVQAELKTAQIAQQGARQQLNTAQREFNSKRKELEQQISEFEGTSAGQRMLGSLGERKETAAARARRLLVDDPQGTIEEGRRQLAPKPGLEKFGRPITNKAALNRVLDSPLQNKDFVKTAAELEKIRERLNKLANAEQMARENVLNLNTQNNKLNKAIGDNEAKRNKALEQQAKVSSELRAMESKALKSMTRGEKKIAALRRKQQADLEAFRKNQPSPKEVARFQKAQNAILAKRQRILRASSRARSRGGSQEKRRLAELRRENAQLIRSEKTLAKQKSAAAKSSIESQIAEREALRDKNVLKLKENEALGEKAKIEQIALEKANAATDILKLNKDLLDEELKLRKEIIDIDAKKSKFDKSTRRPKSAKPETIAAEDKAVDDTATKLKEAETQRTTAAKSTLDAQASAESARLEANKKQQLAQQSSADQQRLMQLAQFRQEFERNSLQESQRLELEIRKKGFEQRFAMLDAAEQKRLKSTGKYRDMLLKIEEDHVSAVSALVIQNGANIASASEDAFGALGTLAEEMGAGKGVIGVLESLMIAAKGVYHGFMGGSELAQAASATAIGNVPGAVAHKIAAAAHFAQAAVAGIQAGKALVGGGGGGGSTTGASAAAAASSGPRVTSEDRSADRERDEARIQFGDIVLSDVPALLSRQGSRQLGERIASDVARALNRARAIPGGSRI